MGGIGLEEGGHGVIELQDTLLGAIVAVSPFVLAFHDGEALHDVFHGMTGSGKVGGEG
jgi:hypothetical protein